MVDLTVAQGGMKLRDGRFDCCIGRYETRGYGRFDCCTGRYKLGDRRFDFCTERYETQGW